MPSLAGMYQTNQRDHCMSVLPYLGSLGQTTSLACIHLGLQLSYGVSHNLQQATGGDEEAKVCSTSRENHTSFARRHEDTKGSCTGPMERNPWNELVAVVRISLYKRGAGLVASAMGSKDWRLRNDDSVLHYPSVAAHFPRD